MDNMVGTDYGSGDQTRWRWMKGETIGITVKHKNKNKKKGLLEDID